MTLRRLHRFTTITCLAAGLGLTAVAAGQSRDLTDRDITLAVETDLIVDDSVPAHRIDVTTNEGIVTLTGHVNNLLARERAIKRAMSIKGVRSVVDRINVNVPVRPDRELARDVEVALVSDPATDSYELDVSVANGTVTLRGEVDSWQERRLATMVAKGVRGVKKVKNDAVIDYDTDRNDYEIRADIERRLGSSVWVNATLVDVAVEDGKVELTGTVGSEAERRRALALAWVAGVEDVAVDGLETNWWAEHEMRRDERFAMPADAEIEHAVEDAMMYDPRVFSFNVDATADAGAVTLTGVVGNLKAKRAAETNARNTRGVWRVMNHLRVRPASMPADPTIAAGIREALRRDPYVERYDLDVDVVAGLVYLSGDVNTSFERQQAEEVASRVKGVIEIDNNIEFDHEWTWQPDREIKASVESQLFWSPFVDSQDIRVAVEDGVVTLMGTVSDWSEWRDAAENAFQGGAKDVRNKLKISTG